MDGTFEGFRRPVKEYFGLPNEWTNITAHINNLAELKIIEYIIRHTWGFKEYTVYKTITTDEFMHGRKYKDNTRMDEGTGLSKQSVISGIDSAIKHGYIECEIDNRDASRVKKSYRVKMRQSDVKDLDTETQSKAKSDVKNLDEDVKDLDSSVKDLDSIGQDVRQRSEKDTFENNFKKPTIERKNVPVPTKINGMDILSFTQSEWFTDIFLQSKIGRVPPREITDDMKRQIEYLMPHIASVDSLNSLYEYAKKEIEVDSKKKNKTVFLGNLVEYLHGWLQAQERETVHQFQPEEQIEEEQEVQQAPEGTYTERYRRYRQANAGRRFGEAAPAADVIEDTEYYSGDRRIVEGHAWPARGEQIETG